MHYYSKVIVPVHRCFHKFGGPLDNPLSQTLGEIDQPNIGSSSYSMGLCSDNQLELVVARTYLVSYGYRAFSAAAANQ